MAKVRQTFPKEIPKIMNVCTIAGHSSSLEFAALMDCGEQCGRTFAVKRPLATCYNKKKPLLFFFFFFFHQQHQMKSMSKTTTKRKPVDWFQAIVAINSWFCHSCEERKRKISCLLNRHGTEARHFLLQLLTCWAILGQP